MRADYGFLALLSFSIAHANDASSSRNLAALGVAQPQAESESGVPRYTDTGDKSVRVNGGAGLLRERYGNYYGAALGLAFRPTFLAEVMVGADIGFYYRSRQGEGTGVAVRIREDLYRVLPTLLYRHKGGGRVHPTIGISIGPAIVFHSAYGVVNGVLIDSAGTNVWISGALRPGVDVDITQSVGMALEPKIGFIRDQFFLNPELSLVLGF